MTRRAASINGFHFYWYLVLRGLDGFESVSVPPDNKAPLLELMLKNRESSGAAA
jgi:hypothetical protein